MTITTAILSLVIIVLCGSLIYMYFFGTAKIKPSDIVDLVDYKIKLSQLSNRIDMIEKKELFECRPIGSYPSKDKTYIELSSEIRYHTEMARELGTKIKAIDEATPVHYKNCLYGYYKGKIDLSLEPSEESRKKFMERIKPQAPEDRLVNQAKKPTKPREQASPNKTNSTIKGR